MDPHQRATRGRARLNTQPLRSPGIQQRPVQPPGAFMPRGASHWPRPPAQAPRASCQIRAPRPPGPRPENVNEPQNFHSSQPVQQLTQGMGKLTSEDHIPIGCGGIRGRQVLNTEIEYFRASRPLSSKNGKGGTSGQPVDLIANYFPITSYTDWTLYQYQVKFSPEEDRIMIKRGLLGSCRDKLGAFIFDGTMLFSSTLYPKEIKLSSKRECDGQIIVITVSFTGVLEKNDYAYIQVFNLLLRNCLRHLELTLVGRNYYDPKAKITIDRYRLQLWPGYETTIGMFDSGLLLRAEISMKVMREDSVLDFFKECFKYNRNNYMDHFKAGVIGSVVLTQYNNQTYKIDDIDDSSTPRSTFNLKDGSKMSYMEYYKTKWNITIRDGNQPMLVSKKKKMLGKNDEDLIYLVPELCSMTGITQRMRDDRSLMQELSKHTRVNPADRVIKIYNFNKRLQSTEKSIKTLNDWNLNLHPELVKIKGRVLAPQTILSNEKMYESGVEADWTRHLRALPMFNSARLTRWFIVYPNQAENEIRSFVRTLQQVATNMAFTVPRPDFCPINARNISGYSSALDQIVNQYNPSFILCVNQSDRADYYSLIKRQLSIDRAVPSQVVLLKNVAKNNMSVCTKIAIQINCKLGGAPWTVKIPTGGIMIVGFDVCHDKQHKNKSYGALVASINDDHSHFYSCSQQHPSGEELSSHFASAISGALDAYKKLNKKLPAMIIIYRDGVGDGQISYVHKTEVNLVKKACKDFYGGVEPPMAFIIVKKRISTRFFNYSGSCPSNPLPGTVVDTVITDPTMYDFFLVSQNVKFGTVTPTHYNVIEDTLPNWSPNKMQLLTYKLTHMYYNWSGTVRVPAHCQLAHKLAFLCGQTLHGAPNVALNELLHFL